MNLSQFDSQHRRVIASIGLDTGTDPDKIANAVSCAGDVWECRAFLNRYPHGTPESAPLIEHLRQGSTASESVLTVIKKFAPPSYRTIAEATDAELDELLVPV